MKSLPLVSILIPCYNAERWLAATVDSALAQTWKNLEVIVVNDGSTDDSAKVLAGYERQNLRIVDQANRGQCAAANRALAEARGDYVKFLDADDLINPTMIERQVAVLGDSRQHLAHAEWARFAVDPAEADFTPQECWHDAGPADWLTEAWTGGRPMHQCGIFLIPRELLIRTGGWDERLSLINDFEFFARVISASEGIRFSPGARVYYRSGMSGSLSQQTSRKAWESAFLSANLAVDHLLKLENSDRSRRAAADCLMELATSMYPFATDLVQTLEARIRKLGGTDIRPRGGRGFRLLRSLLGWKAARRLQTRIRGH